MRIKTLLKIAQNQGLKYIIFRSFYELRKKSGLLAKNFPTEVKEQTFITFKDWKNSNSSFLFNSRRTLKIPKNRNISLKKNFEKISEGSVRFFNHQWLPISKWVENIDTRYTYSIDQHWTRIQDISKEAGDIKYVWEKSRFSFIYDIIRYDYHFEQDNARLVFDEILDWIDKNPLNKGPNYVCSQEISLRCLNWIFALNFYKESEDLNEESWQKIFTSIYWQIKHVYANINFSRISVKNNHAITESMIIYFAGLFFPFLKEAKDWKIRGKNWLEEEIAYQVYDDGTYLQFSHNYQRVLAQLLSWSISVSRFHNDSLNKTVLDKSHRVIEYMQRCCVGKRGEMPNYGSNDGALFFKLNNLDYTDFRPTINALNYVLNGTHLYEDSEVKEDAFWFSTSAVFFEEPNTSPTGIPIQKQFKNGGIYTIKESNSFTFFKCSSYKDRPSHADNMHLDLWVDGINILRDSGTYKYNTTEKLINYFAGTLGHNSLLINNENQMIKGPRFIWFDWTKDASVKTVESKSKVTMFAEAKMFPSLGKSIRHKRTITKFLSHNEWIIEDEIINLPDLAKIKQVWHPHPKLLSLLKFQSRDFQDKEITLSKESGFWSDHYGQKQKVPICYFESDGNVIKTRISFFS